MPLDGVGRAQAAALARRLAAEPVTAVYASRALRAQQTAAPVAAAHALPVVPLDGVHEVSCGDLEGNADAVSRARFAEVYQGWLRGELDARLPGGDSALDLRARFVPAVESVLEGGTLVVVSHGAAIPLAVGAMLGEHTLTRRRRQHRRGDPCRRARRLGAGALGRGRAGRRRHHRRHDRQRGAAALVRWPQTLPG